MSLERNLGIDWEHEQNSQEEPPESMQTNEIYDDCTELRNSPSATYTHVPTVREEDAYKQNNKDYPRHPSFGSS